VTIWFKRSKPHDVLVGKVALGNATETRIMAAISQIGVVISEI